MPNIRDLVLRAGAVRRTRSDLALAVAMFGLITLLRFTTADDVAGISFFYVVPVSLLAVGFGYRGGLLGAGAAMACVGWWRVVQESPDDLLEFAMRGVVFLLVGVLVGAQSERRRKLEAEREVLIAQLRAMALEDPLTGLLNRRGWDERFRHEFDRARRSAGPLTIVAIDLDHLKRINDTQGHAAGDDLIASCAAAWKGALRSTDFLARLGGDEFVAVLPECSETCARAVAERAYRSGPPGDPFSVGIAVWDGHESAVELVRRADEALYEAKEAGRGRIATAPAPART